MLGITTHFGLHLRYCGSRSTSCRSQQSCSRQGQLYPRAVRRLDTFAPAAAHTCTAQMCSTGDAGRRSCGHRSRPYSSECGQLTWQLGHSNQLRIKCRHVGLFRSEYSSDCWTRQMLPYLDLHRTFRSMAAYVSDRGRGWLAAARDRACQNPQPSCQLPARCELHRKQGLGSSPPPE